MHPASPPPPVETPVRRAVRTPVAAHGARPGAAAGLVATGAARRGVGATGTVAATAATTPGAGRSGVFWRTGRCRRRSCEHFGWLGLQFQQAQQCQKRHGQQLRQPYSCEQWRQRLRRRPQRCRARRQRRQEWRQQQRWQRRAPTSGPGACWAALRTSTAADAVRMAAGKAAGAVHGHAGVVTSGVLRAVASSSEHSTPRLCTTAAACCCHAYLLLAKPARNLHPTTLATNPPSPTRGWGRCTSRLPPIRTHVPCFVASEVTLCRHVAPSHREARLPGGAQRWQPASRSYDDTQHSHSACYHAHSVRSMRTHAGRRMPPHDAVPAHYTVQLPAARPLVLPRISSVSSATCQHGLS